MKIVVVHPDELGAPELTKWRGFQRSLPSLANPFLAPEFTVVVGRLRPRTRVAVLSEGSEIVAFFPFERRRFGYGVPVAAGLTDCQGLVHAPGLEWDPQSLLRSCDLAVWEFDHLVDGQKPFEPYQVVRTTSPVIDVSGGYEAYLQQLRAKSRSFVRDLQRQLSRLERDVGKLRCVLDSREHDALRTVLAWKSDQYRRTGRSDRFAHPWIVDLVEQLLDTRTSGFSGLLSMLYAGDEPVAGHFGLRFDHVLSTWFPAYDTRFKRHSPGLLQHLCMVEAAAAARVEQIDMGRGAKDYKERFKSKDLVVAEGRVVRRSPAAAVHWARQVPMRRLRNTIVEHPSLYRIADGVLKQYGRLQALMRPSRLDVSGRDEGASPLNRSATGSR